MPFPFSHHGWVDFPITQINQKAADISINLLRQIQNDLVQRWARTNRDGYKLTFEFFPSLWVWDPLYGVSRGELTIVDSPESIRVSFRLNFSFFDLLSLCIVVLFLVGAGRLMHFPWHVLLTISTFFVGSYGLRYSFRLFWFYEYINAAWRSITLLQQ